MEEDYTQIEAYLNGSLKNEEKKKFEEKLTANSSLARELALHKMAIDIVRVNEDLEAKRYLQSLDRKLTRQNEQKRAIRTYGILALLLVSFALILFFRLNSTTDKSPEQLYAEYFSPYSADFLLKRNESIGPEEEALMHYTNKEYDKVLYIYDNIPDEKTTNLMRLLLGVSYLTVDQSDTAILLFVEVIELQNQWSGIAEWYLGLAYLKSKNMEAAKQQFQKIVDNKGYNAKEAKEVLYNLE